jgi:hypothetical protein
MSDQTGDYSDLQTMQSIGNVQLHGTSGLPPPVIETTWVLPGRTEWSQPRYGLTEGIMMLADNVILEVTVIIGLS